MTSRPSILVLSFSPIVADARVLKQVRLASGVGDVTTCGYGPAPEGVVRHIRIPDELHVQPFSPKLMLLRMRDLAYRRSPAVRWVRRALNGPDFDAVFANDLESLPVALTTRSRGGVHADLHEYTPRMNDHLPSWKRHLTPLFSTLARRYLPRAVSSTTVGERIAREYENLTGVLPEVVVNAAPFADLAPSRVASPIRLVHSGACLRRRRLDLLLEAVAACETPVTLDLYLTPNDPGFLQELKTTAEGIPGIVVHDPVPYQELIATLNDYDIGLHVLPPINFNNEWALPNKIFDYGQARLGIVVGPSAEMASFVEANEVGLVSDDFTADSLRRVLEGLDTPTVEQFKAAAHSRARDFSAEAMMGPWRAALDGMLARAAAS